MGKRKLEETNQGYESYKAALTQLRNYYTSVHREKGIMSRIIDNMTFEEVQEALEQKRDNAIKKAEEHIKTSNQERYKRNTYAIIRNSSAKTSEEHYFACMQELLLARYNEMKGLSPEEKESKITESEKEQQQDTSSFVEKERKRRTVDEIAKDMGGMQID